MTIVLTTGDFLSELWDTCQQMKRSRSTTKPLLHAIVKQGLFSEIFGWGTGIRTPTAWARTRCSTLKLSPSVVPKVGFEPTRGHPHYALNVARLPIPPLRPEPLARRRENNTTTGALCQMDSGSVSDFQRLQFLLGCANEHLSPRHDVHRPMPLQRKRKRGPLTRMIWLYVQLNTV